MTRGQTVSPPLAEPLVERFSKPHPRGTRVGYDVFNSGSWGLRALAGLLVGCRVPIELSAPGRVAPGSKTKAAYVVNSATPKTSVRANPSVT